jgi:hypothetical protein
MEGNGPADWSAKQGVLGVIQPMLAKTAHLDPVIRQDRYAKELRLIHIGDPLQHDRTLQLWIETYFPRC